MALESIPVWSIRPDWTDGLIERLDWNTGLLSSPSNAEQRFGARLSPRKEFDVSFIIAREDRTYFDLFVLRAGGQPLYAPIWYDVEQLVADLPSGSTVVPASTLHTEFPVVRAVLLWRGTFDYELVEVSSMTDTDITLAAATTKDWAAGTRVYPVKKCRISGSIQTSRRSAAVISATIRFQSLEPNRTVESIALNSYNGNYILEQTPNDTGDLAYTLEHVMFDLDNSTGLQALLDVVGVPSQQFKWYAKGREALGQLRALLYTLDGRRVPIWVPTFYRDFELVDDITSGDTSIEITRCGYTDAGGPFAARENIVIELRDGNRVYQEITGSALVGAGDTERVSFGDPFAVSISKSFVKRISFVSLCRLDQDSIELQHPTTSAGLTTASAVFRYVKDILPAASGVGGLPADFVIVESAYRLVYLKSVTPDIPETFPYWAEGQAAFSPGDDITSASWAGFWSFEAYDPVLGTYFYDESLLYAGIGWPDQFDAYHIYPGSGVGAVSPVGPAPFQEFTFSPFYNASYADVHSFYDALSVDEKPLYAVMTSDGIDQSVYRYGSRLQYASFFADGLVDEPGHFNYALMAINAFDLSQHWSVLINMAVTSLVDVRQATDNFQAGHSPTPYVVLRGYVGGTFSIDPITKRWVNTGGTLVWTASTAPVEWPPVRADTTSLGTFTASGFTPA